MDERFVAQVERAFATANSERLVAGGRTVEVAQVQITEAGRRALEG